MVTHQVAVGCTCQEEEGEGDIMHQLMWQTHLIHIDNVHDLSK